MKQCCNTCRKKLELEKYDYSQGGCIHTDYEGYACLIFASEGVVIHMVGADPDKERCEEWSPKNNSLKVG